MGESVAIVGIESALLERVANDLSPFSAVASAVDGQGLIDDAPHRHPGIEGAERVLKNDLHILPHGAQLGRRHSGQIFPFELHGTRRVVNQS